MQRNARRPYVMKNYTRQGFAKIRAPPELWSLVESFWNINGLPPAESSNPNWELEGWDDGESLINHWTSPTYFVSLSNSTLAGGGPGLEDAIWKTSKSTLEAWTGQRLKGCSLYGVRVYTSESVLHTHVDRVPLISSAILNVGQDTDEPWPLEVIGHDGQARNITMVPGDMVLYESHTILHGRPFPLKGRYMANIFVHFEVLSDQDEDNQPFPNLEYERVTSEDYQAIVKEHNRHWGKQRNNVSTRLHHLAGNGRLDDIKDFVEMNGKHTVHARDDQGWQPIHEAARTGRIETIHFLLEQGADINALTHTGETPTYARDGDLNELRQLADDVNPRLLYMRDKNGWTPLHEAARMGQAHVVEYLIQQGASLNALTNAGGTPLYIAAKFQGTESPIYNLLQQLGGLHLGPEL